MKSASANSCVTPRKAPGRPQTSPTLEERRYVVQRLRAGLAYYGAAAGDLYDCSDMAYRDPYFETSGAARDAVTIHSTGYDSPDCTAIKWHTTREPSVDFSTPHARAIRDDLSLDESTSRAIGGNPKKARERVARAVNDALNESRKTSAKRFRDLFLLLYYCQKRTAWLNANGCLPSDVFARPLDKWRWSCVLDDRLWRIVTRDVEIVDEMLLAPCLVNGDLDLRLVELSGRALGSEKFLERSQGQTLTHSITLAADQTLVMRLSLQSQPEIVAALRLNIQSLEEEQRRAAADERRRAARLRELRIALNRLDGRIKHGAAPTKKE